MTKSQNVSWFIVQFRKIELFLTPTSMMDRVTYKRKYDQICDEEKKMYDDMYAKRNQVIQKSVDELEVVRRLYEQKRDEHDKLVRRENEDLDRKAEKLRKTVDWRLKNLKQQETPYIVQEDKKPMTLDESLDMLIKETALKYQKPSVKIQIQKSVELPANIYDKHSKNVIATLCNYDGPRRDPNSTLSREVRTGIFCILVKHVLKTIGEHYHEISNLLQSGHSEVELEFSQTFTNHPDKNILYKDIHGMYVHVYFDHVFRNDLSARIMKDKIEKAFPLFRVVVTQHSCLLTAK